MAPPTTATRGCSSPKPAPTRSQAGIPRPARVGQDRPNERGGGRGHAHAWIDPAPAPLPTLDPPGARIAAQPAFVEPMLATPGTAPFDGEDWLFEPKWDGYRVQAIVAGGQVALRTRKATTRDGSSPSCSGRRPGSRRRRRSSTARWSRSTRTVGPTSACSRRGSAAASPRPMPAGSPAASGGTSAPLVFMAFDLPWCAGRSYLDVPLEERKAILRLVLREHPQVRFGGHVARDGVAFFAAAAAQGLEGAMAKHRRSRYEAGRRSTAWLKLKVRPTQELVVAGYVPGQGSHRDLGALIVGVMDGGRLRYAGRVGSGLDARDARPPAGRAGRPGRPDAPLRRCARRPRADPGGGLGERRSWSIRAEIGGWSRDGIVRQASFAHEAPEVDPASVERQAAVGPEAAARALAKRRRRQRASALSGADARGSRGCHGPEPAARSRRAWRHRAAAPARPASAATAGARRPRRDARARRAWEIGGTRGGADQPRQGPRPGSRPGPETVRTNPRSRSATWSATSCRVAPVDAPAPRRTGPSTSRAIRTARGAPSSGRRTSRPATPDG